MTYKKRVYIIHGFQGRPNGGWRPWLMGELAKRGIYACALPMPDPEQPVREKWVEEIGRAVGAPNESVVLVGHSLGVLAILHYLQLLPSSAGQINRAFLCSGPAAPIKQDVSDHPIRAIDNFFTPAFDAEKIRAHCELFTIIHGDNDTAVPVSHAERLQELLGGELVLISNGGHLGGEDGVYEIDELLEGVVAAFDTNSDF